MKGQCKCGVKYCAKQEDCKFSLKPFQQIEQGYYYIKCSDCHRKIKMEEWK